MKNVGKAKENSSPTPFSAEGFDLDLLPDHDVEFISSNDLEEFAKALSAPDDPVDASSGDFFTAQNDWRPIHQRVRRKLRSRSKRRRQPRRGPDEYREGISYQVFKWPLLLLVLAWLLILGILYLLTRFYIWIYEHFVAWRGQRERLRRNLQSAATYSEWVRAAKALDTFLGNDDWKEDDQYAYYDHKTLKKVTNQLMDFREKAEEEEGEIRKGDAPKAIDKLTHLVEASLKSNFAGLENPLLYSQTYYGTKDLIQDYFSEAEKALTFLLRTTQIDQSEKRTLFKHLYTNYGRSALCLSGGASFAYYHFGVCKALLDANLLPEVITGTSGGALVAALIATRTDEELKHCLVPALASKITACEESITVWLRRWWKTGARFDSVQWARKCSWFTRGSMTFREAYERTGRILNVTCVPADPHSPTILANYLTSPDCVIWSAVLASAAVPGILNPVVLMMKQKDGSLSPYSFGHKWKDGSLRTDIPLKALNLHFNVNFSIVSQVNPHVNLFFFSSRGSVGRPVTHRKGRGWRGGFLGSAAEQYLKLDLIKWLKVLRHLELLPRPMGQDWSELWLQNFVGTITLWPKTATSDFYHILSDPTPERMARMLHAGQHSAFPKLNFLSNRIISERLIETGWTSTRTQAAAKGGISRILSDDDLQSLLIREGEDDRGMSTASDDDIANDELGSAATHSRNASSTIGTATTEDGSDEPFMRNPNRSNSLAKVFSWLPAWKSKEHVETDEKALLEESSGEDSAGPPGDIKEGDGTGETEKQRQKRVKLLRTKSGRRASEPAVRAEW